MKKIIYFFAAISIIFIFINNAAGPVNVQQVGYTGAPVDQSSTCSSCHSSGNYNATAKIEVYDATGSTLVTKYELNKQYIVRLTIAVGSGTPSGYGFQMIDLRASDNTNVKGFLPTAQQASGIGVRTITATGRVYAEHTSRLNTKVINVKWQSPSSNVGVISLYGAANAVNGDGDTNGDSPTSGVSFDLAPSTTQTNELAEYIKIQVSPNPTPSAVVVSLESDVSKSLKVLITDIRGRTVFCDNWAVSIGNNQRTIDMNSFTKGAYMVQLVDNQNVLSKKILKL